MREFFKEISLRLMVVVAASTLLYGCDAGFEENGEQRDDIVSYLKSSHTPKLIPEDEVAESLEDNPNFYSEFGTYAYLYIDDYYNPDRESRKLITKGSKITITFRLYPFSGSAIKSDVLPVYTNDPSYEDSYNVGGLNSEYWSFEPLEITIGKSSILESIQQALLKGCREGDSVEIYMTRNMGYDDAVIGVMEEDSAILFYCTINSVN